VLDHQRVSHHFYYFNQHLYIIFLNIQLFIYLFFLFIYLYDMFILAISSGEQWKARGLCIGAEVHFWQHGDAQRRFSAAAQCIEAKLQSKISWSWVGCSQELLILMTVAFNS
jgi:hypothetical protein